MRVFHQNFLNPKINTQKVFNLPKQTGYFRQNFLAFFLHCAFGLLAPTRPHPGQKRQNHFTNPIPFTDICQNFRILMQSEQLRFGHHWQFQQILFELVVVGVLRREINATRREFVLFEKQRGREVVRQDV
jgi:hypothetical protein